jgi:hypothetical protein
MISLYLFIGIGYMYIDIEPLRPFKNVLIDKMFRSINKQINLLK